MRSIAMIVCGALFSLNAEAALWHVHLEDHDDDHHQGPAAHLHEIAVPQPAGGTQVGEPDDDHDLGIPIGLSKATTSPPHHLAAAPVAEVIVESPAVTRLAHGVLTERAHGPPAGRPCSLRAPPRSIPL
jgi:hypothetical protein